MGKARTILVPIDGSPFALRALKWAASRAGKIPQARIVVLNVQPPLPTSLFVTREMVDDYQRRQAALIIKRATALAKKMRVKIQAEMRVGDPAPTIARMARRTHCSEIVMGTRGLGRLAGVILGSTSTKVLHLTPVPVTLIH